MSTTITWLGHSAFQIVIDGTTLLIDPFLSDNPRASVAAEDCNPDVILLTHGHQDHVGDTVELARRCDALVVANFEICHWLQKQKVQSTHAMHLGGSHRFEWGRLKLTLAHHGSMLPDGSYGGNPAGLLLETADGVIYHAGDTALFLDMQLIGEAGIDVALLPIGDNYTMGPADALRAVQLLQPRVVIPMHYGTWPLIDQDVDAWAGQVADQTESEPIVLQPGESYEL